MLRGVGGSVLLSIVVVWVAFFFLFFKPGKTPEEIRKTFNIKNDFTPEEEEQVWFNDFLFSSTQTNNLTNKQANKETIYYSFILSFIQSNKPNNKQG